MQLTFCPYALSFYLFLRIVEPAHTILQAIFPFASVSVAILVSVGALSVLFVFEVVAFVSPTVLPDVDALAVHDSFAEVTGVRLAIRPNKAPVTCYLIIGPHARVPRAIGLEEVAFAFFDTPKVHTVV